MPQSPEPTPTAAQRERASRSLAVLAARRVPPAAVAVYAADDAQTALRPASEAVRRVRVLQAVVQRAEAAPRDMILREVSKRKLWPSVGPAEKRFLECEVPDEQESRALVWRLEAMWALMWALGHLPELGWPGQRCNVPRLGKLLHPKEGIQDLEGASCVRPAGVVLDAIDLLMRLDSVVREAGAAGRPIPAHLDWSQPGELLPALTSPPARITAERLRALRWLTGERDAEWDFRAP